MHMDGQMNRWLVDKQVIDTSKMTLMIDGQQYGRQIYRKYIYDR